MKILLKIVFFSSLLIIIIGFILNNFTSQNGHLFIGVGVLLFAFILMPLFIYHRYKDRIGDFIDSRMEQPVEKDDKWLRQEEKDKRKKRREKRIKSKECSVKIEKKIKNL